MALQVPLIIAADGHIARLPPADTISSGEEFSAFQLSEWVPQPGVAALTGIGIAAPTATGTATVAATANTNKYTRLHRAEYLVAVAATTAVAGWRGAVLSYSIGSTLAGEGGFEFMQRWAPATGVATATNRAFVGLANTTAAPTDVEPSTIANIVGMGWDAADAQIQIMHRGAGAVTKIPLGAAFPVPTVDRTSVYDLYLTSSAGPTQSVSYRVVNKVSGASATGTITTNLPTTGAFLAPRGWMSVGGTSSVIGISNMGMKIKALIA